jgi:hypothetical protein
MAFKKTNKKAQAAIEFLMTYGWMLLVVLIVGALIFSFVDFGNLLPSTVDFSSSSIQGDPQASSAYNNLYGSGLNNVVYVAFAYSGGNRATINASDVILKDDISNNNCLTTMVANDDTGANSSTTSVPFINGQKGTLTFTCTSPTLIEGDSFEGEIIISLEDSKRPGRLIPNKGTMRLPVQ